MISTLLRIMQRQSILVIVVVVYCQDGFTQSQNANEVRQAIDLFRNASSTALEEGSQQLTALIAEIEILSFALTEIGFIKNNESLALANKQIDLEEEKGVYVIKCVHEARGDLSSLLNHLSKLVNNCGANARHETDIINDILNILSIDIDLIINNYGQNMDACIKYKNETCLQELLTAINENVEVYPKEVSMRLNLTSTNLEDVKTDLGKCIANTDGKASIDAKKIIHNLSECIKQNMKLA